MVYTEKTNVNEKNIVLVKFLNQIVETLIRSRILLVSIAFGNHVKLIFFTSTLIQLLIFFVDCKKIQTNCVKICFKKLHFY